MALFIECLLWWMVAVALILRWFNVSSQDVDGEDECWPIASGKHETPHARDGALSES